LDSGSDSGAVSARDSASAQALDGDSASDRSDPDWGLSDLDSDWDLLYSFQTQLHTKCHEFTWSVETNAQQEEKIAQRPMWHINDNGDTPTTNTCRQIRRDHGIVIVGIILDT
jgi:hypothetical protein